MKSDAPFDTWSISPERTSFTSYAASKATPLALESWITLSLTLDGRDKITKIIQYTSRLLGYYFEVLVASYSSSAELRINDTSHHNDDVIRWIEKARRFRNLQKALTQSRKAYRFGRSLVELQKLKEMNILHRTLLYFSQFCHRYSIEKWLKFKDGNQINSCQCHENTKEDQKISLYDVQSLDTKCDNKDIDERKAKIMEESLGKQDNRTNHDLNSQTYLPSLYRIKTDERRQVNETLHSQPPMWKIVSSALKLTGLAGFWAADNVSYLYGIGFWVEDNVDHVTTIGKKNRIAHNIAKSSAIFATRSYFVASLAGLYLNSREWLSHRNGPLRNATDRSSEMEIEKSLLPKGVENSSNYVPMKDNCQNQERQELLHCLEDAKKKHFLLCLFLLKSVCDVIAFSNSPGVDLHKKYRGRKMNEGIQCICGIISALTVLFNKYPNATTVNA